MIYLISISLLIFVIVTSYTDLKHRRIYNKITVPFLILGIIVNVYINGLDGLLFSFKGIGIGFFILLIPFILGWVGGGDVKLLAAVGSWVGLDMIVYSTLWGMIFAGIASLIYLIKKKRLGTFLKQLGLVFYSPKHINLIENSGKLPLGVFLGLGVLMNWFEFVIKM